MRIALTAGLLLAASTFATLTTVAPSASATPASARCITAAEQGQQQRASGKLVAARHNFNTCTALECPSAVRRDCARWIEELDVAIPTITVRLEDGAGLDTSDGAVTMDGERWNPPSQGRATPIDPGSHRFVWDHDGTRIERTVVIHEGERNRSIELRAAPPPKATRAPDPRTSALPPPAHEDAGKSPAPWIVGGVGLGVTAIGVGLWLSGLSDHSSLTRTCAAEHTCATGDVDSAKTKLVVGDIMVGAGVLAIAGALYFILKSDPPPAAAAAR